MRAFIMVVLSLALGSAPSSVAAGGRFRRPRPTAAPARAIGPFWHLDLRVLEFGHINVELPGRGMKTVWYVRHELANQTGEARTISPELALVNGAKTAQDEVLVAAHEAVRLRADPRGELPLLNSVSLSRDAIAPGQTVQAVALWQRVEPGPRATIQVRGLSNGFIDAPETTHYKTLRIAVAGDGANAAPVEWIYLARLRQ